MSAFDSECSSGSESGWTLYLEHSYGDTTRFITEGYYSEENKEKRVTNDENSEDLSMVSDASSGPPHLPYHDHHDANYFNVVKQNKISSKKQKVIRDNKQQNLVQDQQKHLPSFLHDTASSHVFDFSTNNVDATNQQNYTGNMVDYSQGFSATYFEGRSSYQEEQFGFTQSSLSKKVNKWYGGKGMR